MDYESGLVLWCSMLLWAHQWILVKLYKVTHIANKKSLNRHLLINSEILWNRRHLLTMLLSMINMCILEIPWMLIYGRTKELRKDLSTRPQAIHGLVSLNHTQKKFQGYLKGRKYFPHFIKCSFLYKRELCLNIFTNTCSLHIREYSLNCHL